MKQFVRFASIAAAVFTITMLGARPAHAQAAGSQDFSAGYQYTHLSQGGASDSIPAGWYASYAYPMTTAAAILEHWYLTGEINGAYKNGSKMHVFAGGVRGTWATSMQAHPYVEALVGDAHFSNDFGSADAFAVQVGGGVDVPVGGDKYAVRVGVDYRRDFFSDANGGGENDVRVIAGIVIPFTTK